MPNKSGKEAHDEIKKLSATTKFIFISGHARDVLTHQCDLRDSELD
jgi:FixJ family two-component response regulator